MEWACPVSAERAADISKCYIWNGVTSDSRGDGSQNYLHLSSLDVGLIWIFV